MEKHTVPSASRQNAKPLTQKPRYAPPKAVFVPLKLEERLLECSKIDVRFPGCRISKNL
jgi:hypothetical protein